MSDAPAVDPHKRLALELANNQGGEPAKVVERANTYHAFLTGKTAAAAAAAPAAGTQKPTTAPKATPAAGTQTAASSKPGAATPKTGTAATAPKATAAPKATTAPKTGAAANAAGAAPKGDTKDPKGNNTYDDVVAALQKVMRSVKGDNDKRDKGRKLAYDLLAQHGGGVKGVRDLKPALYDAVVAACDAAVNPKAKPAAAPEPDDLGGAPEADDLGGDPVEETSGGLPAEEGQGTVMEGEDV
jgi:hypothetical protein